MKTIKLLSFIIILIVPVMSGSVWATAPRSGGGHTSGSDHPAAANQFAKGSQFSGGQPFVSGLQIAQGPRRGGVRGGGRSISGNRGFRSGHRHYGRGFRGGSHRNYGRGYYGGRWPYYGFGLGYGGLGYYGYGRYWPYYSGYSYDNYRPVIYIQREDGIQETTESQTNYWHYCRNPEGYYPYVKKCPNGWLPVAPLPPTTSNEPAASTTPINVPITQ